MQIYQHCPACSLNSITSLVFQTILSGKTAAFGCNVISEDKSFEIPKQKNMLDFVEIYNVNILFSAVVSTSIRV
jgi:hypothetical protein